MDTFTLDVIPLNPKDLGNESVISEKQSSITEIATGTLNSDVSPEQGFDEFLSSPSIISET